MTTWWRWTLSLVLCAVEAVVITPSPAAIALPSAVSAGVGTVIADFGPAESDTRPGFSHDGAYFAYLAPAGDRCDLHLYDLTARRQVPLPHDHVVCHDDLTGWAADADTLVWQVNAGAGDVLEYAWDAPGKVTFLAPDAHVFARTAYELVPQVSGDGRFLAFTGHSDTHPPLGADTPRTATYIYDRGRGVSLPLSKADVHVDFQTWAPTGHHFTAGSGGRTAFDETGACFGSGTSCRVFPDVHVDLDAQWSRDGTAVIEGSGYDETTLFDYTKGALMPIPDRDGGVYRAGFIGGSADRLLVEVGVGAMVVWDRSSDTLTQVSARGFAGPSPTGRYLLFQGPDGGDFGYRNLMTGASAPSTIRGSYGYWTRDGSSFLVLGPGGCSSLRQWSPATNTISLFGSPPPHTCFGVVSTEYFGPESSASGRFALATEEPDRGDSVPYVVDLRRHVLMGPVLGDFTTSFAPAGGDVLLVRQNWYTSSARLLLVDPTAVPDVDDKPRWSVATPATGARVDAAVGERVHVQLGASDLQGTPVNLYFRWRDSAGMPIASAPKGWSCDRRRLAAGATVADCSFAPPRDYTATRFVDVSATNFATGAQSDTRSYRVRVGS